MLALKALVDPAKLRNQQNKAVNDNYNSFRFTSLNPGVSHDNSFDKQFTEPLEEGKDIEDVFSENPFLLSAYEDWRKGQNQEVGNFKEYFMEQHKDKILNKQADLGFLIIPYQEEGFMSYIVKIYNESNIRWERAGSERRVRFIRANRKR